jgi:hypothetical protein
VKGRSVERVVPKVVPWDAANAIIHGSYFIPAKCALPERVRGEIQHAGVFDGSDQELKSIAVALTTRCIYFMEIHGSRQWRQARQRQPK